MHDLKSMVPGIAVEIQGAIATVTFDRPSRCNALHPEAHRELDRIFSALPENPAVRVVIVTGAGGAFCAGYDLHDCDESGNASLPASGFAGITSRLDYPLPLVAAVDGPAYGGGFETALACDLIVASDRARFALPEPKVGWAALAGGVQRLPQIVGMKRAMGIILTGRSVTATEALELGLVNEIAPAPDLMAAARRWADQIVACAPLAIRCSKQIAYAACMPPASVPDTPLVMTMLESEDALEGRRAFIEKRAPVWIGR